MLYATVVHSCTRSLHLVAGVQLHCHLIKSGLEVDRFVGYSLISLYFKLTSDFNDARRLFDGLRYKDVVSWSSMISGYIRAGKSVKSVELYMEMLDARIEPNAFTLSTMIKACSAILGFKLGKCLYGSVVRCGFGGNEVIVAALIDMYGRNGEESAARQLFDEMPEPDSISI